MGTVSDVKVLGSWNFTLQDDTPLYWLKCGNLDHYLLRARVRCPCPCSVGMVWHSEAEGSGMEGVSFWMERSQGRRRYFLGGSDLESEPVVTREYTTSESDDGGFWTEEWEVLVQGYQGCVFLQGRKVRLKCRSIRNAGAIAFFNATRPSEADKQAWGGSTEVHFSHVSMTTLTRGPLTVSGMLAARENILSYSVSPEEKAVQERRKQQQEALREQNRLVQQQQQQSRTEREQLVLAPMAAAAGGRSQEDHRGLSKDRGGGMMSRSMPSLPKMAPNKRYGREPKVPSPAELADMRQRGEAPPLRMLKAGGQQVIADPRQQIKFMPALKTMQRDERREEMKRASRSDGFAAQGGGGGASNQLQLRPGMSSSAQNFWPLPEAFGAQDGAVRDPDSQLAEVYREPIERLKVEWGQERARAADVDRQMSITFQAVFRLEQRVATLGGSHPKRLREKMEGKLDELNGQLRELHTYRERCTASLRRVEEDIQRIRDRQKYDAYLEAKVGGHMANHPANPGADQEGEGGAAGLKDSTKGLAVQREEKALQLQQKNRGGKN